LTQSRDCERNGSERESMSKLPTGYVVKADVCPNCTHAFARYEYDSESEYFCTLGAPKRPHCGSSCMRECYMETRAYKRIYERKRKLPKGETWKRTVKLMRDQDRKWNKWSSGRQVSRCGSCPSFKQKAI